MLLQAFPRYLGIETGAKLGWQGHDSSCQLKSGLSLLCQGEKHKQKHPVTGSDGRAAPHQRSPVVTPSGKASSWAAADVMLLFVPPQQLGFLQKSVFCTTGVGCTQA